MESITTLTNGAARLRLAGTAVNRLHLRLPAHTDQQLAKPAGVLVGQTERVTAWYERLGEVLAGRSTMLPAVELATPNDSFLDVILPAVDGGDMSRAEQAERLLWSGQYVGDVNRTRADLVDAGRRDPHDARETVVASVNASSEMRRLRPIEMPSRRQFTLSPVSKP